MLHVKTTPQLLIAFCALLLLSVQAAGGAVPQPSPAELAKSAGSFLLRPGVVVDPARGALYMMHPDSGVEALEIASGDVLWSSAAAARPLALYGDYLLAQAEGVGGTLEVALLHTGLDGQARLTVTAALPEGVEARIDEDLGKAFDARAFVDQGEVYIAWSFNERRVSPLPPGMLPVEPPVALGGTLRLDMASATLVPVEGADAPLAPPPPRPDLADEARLPGVAGVQFLGAGGDDVMVRELVADDRVWEKWEWTIYRYPSGLEAGAARTPVAWAPFFVAESILVYASQPWVRLVGDELTHQPMSLVAVDLSGDQQVWSRALRDTTYRGPFPP